MGDKSRPARELVENSSFFCNSCFGKNKFHRRVSLPKKISSSSVGFFRTEEEFKEGHPEAEDVLNIPYLFVTPEGDESQNMSSSFWILTDVETLLKIFNGVTYCCCCCSSSWWGF